MPKYSIPLSEPFLKGNEWQYIKECLDTGWISSAGKYVHKFEQKIAEYTGSKYAIAFVNGTCALQVSLRLAGVSSGDEVIVPTLTFIAPVNAVAYNEAIPIFMDADQYYNIDAEKTIDFIRNETKYKDGFSYNKITDNKISAIVPVHVWGNAGWLDELGPLCNERNIAIVEDASESLGTFYSTGIYSDRHTGTIGRVGCISFNGNKITTTGGGGMILTDDVKLAEKSRYLSTQAKDDPIRYIHNEIGYNFRLTNIQAAMGVAQLEQLSGFLKRKQDIHQKYVKTIKTIEGLTVAKVPGYAKNNYWMNILKIDSATYDMDREGVMEKLEKSAIQTRPIWTLNHKQRPFKDYQSFKIDRADELVNNSLCLPSSTNLDNDNINSIISCLIKK